MSSPINLYAFPVPSPGPPARANKVNAAGVGQFKYASFMRNPISNALSTGKMRSLKNLFMNF
jgi:hypothetical protein